MPNNKEASLEFPVTSDPPIKKWLNPMSGGSSYKSIICTTTVQALPFIPDVFLHKRTFHKTWKEILMLECPTVAIKSIVPFLIF